MWQKKLIRDSATGKLMRDAVTGKLMATERYICKTSGNYKVTFSDIIECVCLPDAACDVWPSDLNTTFTLNYYGYFPPVRVFQITKDGWFLVLNCNANTGKIFIWARYGGTGLYRCYGFCSGWQSGRIITNSLSISDCCQDYDCDDVNGRGAGYDGEARVI